MTQRYSYTQMPTARFLQFTQFNESRLSHDSYWNCSNSHSQQDDRENNMVSPTTLKGVIFGAYIFLQESSGCAKKKWRKGDRHLNWS